MIRAKALFLAVLTFSVWTLPAVEAKARNELVLQGSRTTYIDLEFNKPVRLDAKGAHLTYSGAYAGWFLKDHSSPSYTGSFAFRDVVRPDESPNEPLFTYGETDPTLAPGRYRLILIADGPTKVTVPILEGMASAVFRPERRTRTQVVVNDFDVKPAMNDVLTKTVTIRPSTIPFTMMLITYGPGGGALQATVCMTPKEGSECGGVTFGPSAWQTLGEGNSALVAKHYGPGDFTPGRYEASHEMISVGTLVEVIGAAVLVDVGDIEK